MDSILNGLEAKHRFRDPIYGFIRLTDAELAIVDSPLFQRLRRVHQLALTKYVYPSAEHSRFVHSLGVLHASTAMFSAVVNNENSGYKYNNDQKLTLCKILRFAALLHDIGHLPFSHAAEHAWLGTFNHEDVSCYIIRNYQPIIDALKLVDVLPDTVASLLTDQFQAHHRLIHEIISGQLDADRADYLLRDSHCCGVQYGEYDFKRYINMFSADGVGDFFRLTIDEKDLHVAEAFILARYHYSMQVPYHRTRSGYDLALQKYLSELKAKTSWFSLNKHNQLSKVNTNRFEQLDDYGMYEEFKRDAKKGNFWARCLLRQDHLRLALDETNNLLPVSGKSADPESPIKTKGEQNFKAYVYALREEGLVADNDFFVFKKEIDILKRAKGRKGEGKEDDGVDPSLTDKFSILVRRHSPSSANNKLLDIANFSWVFQKFDSNPPKILRVYIKPELLDKALDIRDKVIGGA